MVFSLPFSVESVLGTLQSQGFEAFIVGGCVRDMLMGVTPHDYDIATNALPDGVRAMFPRTADTGIKHGTVTVISDGTPVEVTTFRSDGGYSDGRHPDGVRFVSDIREDLARRDFTVNALAYSPRDGLTDPFGGRCDIENRLLKAVGEPEARFSEDALRIIRLFRFASTLGFGIEEHTLTAALKCRAALEKISHERIASELSKSALGQYTAACEPLLRSGALAFAGIADCGSLGRIPLLPAEEKLRLYALLSLCDCDIPAVVAGLKYSNAVRDYCKKMACLRSGGLPRERADIKECMRAVGADVFFDFLRFEDVILGGHLGAAESIAREIIGTGEPYSLRHLAIDGSVLLGSGFSGKAVGKVLDGLLRAVIKEPSFNTREKLLALAQKLKTPHDAE